MGFKGPRKSILGVELAGRVETAGNKVTRFKTGDAVFASTGASFGAHAEYICLPEKAVMATLPSNMTYEEAAAVPHCALAALHFLRKGKVGQGSKVLIHGASGGIGTFAVQIAKSMGAEVTGVCSTANLNLVKSIGADKVIDYTKDELPLKGADYDVIFDTVGKGPVKTYIDALKEKGIYLSAVHLELSRIITGIKASLTSSKKIIGGAAPYTTENLEFLKKLIEAGQLKTVIDKIYSFEQIREAHRYVDRGHKKGNIIISVL
jgi:NADPH:quinone reductase-like Zn-dependent oxidoreductase